MNQTESDFIDELKYCVRQSDFVKAVALLQFFSGISTKAQKMVLFEILKASDKVAYPMLECLSRLDIDDDSISEKVAELILEKSYDNSELIVDYIEKSNKKNKQLYIKVAGNLRLRDAVSVLENILLRETNSGVLEEAIIALGHIGEQSASSTIARFLYGSNEKLKVTAIKSLAELGGSSSIKKLFEGITGTSETDYIIVKSLTEMQDKFSLEKLTELLSSQFVDLRNAAIDGLVEIGPKAIPTVAENLKTDDKDTMIHSLNVLGNIGDITALPAIQKVIYNQPADPNVRFAVYEAMERLPSSKSAISLAQGLTDSVGHVRMAAAKAIDKNLSMVLIAGMKNMIEAQDEQSLNVVATLIDSGADNAFNFLIESKTFQDYAVNHLVETAHPEVRTHFLKLLKSKGEKKLSKRIKDAVAPETSTKKIKVVAVDDSKMMLKIYMRALHEMGYESATYEFPAEAVKAVKKSKPDILITDLNMPEINGLQLTEELRKTYSSKQLPIIMITTQSDISGQAVASNKGSSENAVEKAGIDMVLNKPFQDTELQAAISDLLK